MEFTVCLAGINVAITSLFDEVYDFCRDYLTDAPADMTVSINAEDILHEKTINIREAQIEGIPVVDYPDSHLEILAVYRKIVTKMLDFNSFLMHGAVVAVGDKAWLFTAPSGTGKTTHINLWLNNIPGSYVVNGDKPLIHVGDECTVYGTPWAGKEGMNRNVGVKLCGIVILNRGAENHIEKVPMTQILPVLIQQSYRPKDKVELEKTLSLLSRLGKKIPMYQLYCNMNPDAAFTSYNVLNGEDHE
ncbi:MAG: hypothetical protein IKF31_06535 [Clostridiales bacterium]|nr:hypothetical protein [Clostridiales bacterium]